MTNILLDWLNIDEEPFYSEIGQYIKPGHLVCAVPFSFRDCDAKNSEDWDDLWGKDSGHYYRRMVDPFLAFGIGEDQISFVNYFTDSARAAKEKILSADVLLFPGGLPERMMDRLEEFGLRDTITGHRGVIMGYSAGALIQLDEYHVSPDDEDYAEFSYFRGLPFLNDFYLEVHYEGTDVQNSSIKRIIEERGKKVYAIENGKGALIASGGRVKPIGSVHCFGSER